jgi:hypothetical protein
MSEKNRGSFGHILGRMAIGMVGGAVGGAPGVMIGMLAGGTVAVVEALLAGGAGKQVAAPTVTPPGGWHKALIDDGTRPPFDLSIPRSEPSANVPLAPTGTPLFKDIQMLQQRARMGSPYQRKILSTLEHRTLPAFMKVIQTLRTVENNWQPPGGLREAVVSKFDAAIQKTKEATDAEVDITLRKNVASETCNAWRNALVAARIAGTEENDEELSEDFNELTRCIEPLVEDLEGICNRLLRGVPADGALRGGSHFNIPNDMVFIINLDNGDIKWYKIDRKYLPLVKDMVLDIVESNSNSNKQTNIVRAAAKRVKTLKNRAKTGGKSKTRRGSVMKYRY